MGELNKSFKPETMRIFVKLDEDGKYHEIKNIGSMSIKEEEDGFFGHAEGTITLEGVDLHTSDDSYNIEKGHIKPPKSSFDTISADSPIFYAGSPIYFKPFSKRDRYRKHLPKRVIVSGPCVISFWHDGTKTFSRCHDGDEMDVRTGILLNAIKKWMPGGTYWQGVMDDVEVEYQGKKEKVEKVSIEHHPCRPYMRGGRYGDDEKMAVIEDVDGGMTQAETSRKHGVSQGTVSNWMREWRSGNA